MKILMVCLGNICRSPLAEGILRHKIQERNLNWQVDSAGTGGWHTGEPPHRLSQKIAKAHGISISDLQARTFVKEDILRFDKIYVMDEENYADVKRITEELWDENKVDLILSVLGKYRLNNYEFDEVPDPWYVNTGEAFEQVYQMLNAACDKIIMDKTIP